tara:strand:+ start:5639 stop:5899 length:261 start_codon:yes stop_codon:yes gene_type:complete
MTVYRCECGKQEKEISRAIIGLREGKWVCVDAKCECGKYMDSTPAEGMPSIKRTEESLNRNKKRDKLWEKTKEQIVGDRGINEDFK